MRRILLILVSFLLLNFNEPFLPYSNDFLKKTVRTDPKMGYPLSFIITDVTAYNPIPNQTSSHPCFGAWGDNLCASETKGIHPIAVHPSTGLGRGSRVMIAGVEYRVLDHIPSRGVVDVFMFSYRQAMQHGRKRHIKMHIIEKKK